MSNFDHAAELQNECADLRERLAEAVKICGVAHKCKGCGKRFDNPVCHDCHGHINEAAAETAAILKLRDEVAALRKERDMRSVQEVRVLGRRYRVVREPDGTLLAFPEGSAEVDEFTQFYFVGRDLWYSAVRQDPATGAVRLERGTAE